MYALQSSRIVEAALLRSFIWGASLRAAILPWVRTGEEEHAMPASTEVRPAGHLLQVAHPSTSLNLPLGHILHTTKPTLSEYMPGAQERHFDMEPSIPIESLAPPHSSSKVPKGKPNVSFFCTCEVAAPSPALSHGARTCFPFAQTEHCRDRSRAR